MAKKASKAKPKKAAKKGVNKSKKTEVSTKDTISFDYIKSNQFRVIRVDGAHGGIAPKRHAIQMALFSERAPIPKRETYKLEKESLGQRIEIQERDAIIREVEVEALMDLETAKAINKWLGEKIKLASDIEQKVK